MSKESENVSLIGIRLLFTSDSASLVSLPLPAPLNIIWNLETSSGHIKLYYRTDGFEGCWLVGFV